MRWRASFALALSLTGCGGTPHLIPDATGYVGYRAEGVASWYGAELAGRRTASGEPFDPAALTAAHRLLPFGTLVEVTAIGSGRAVVVRINDRGPFRDGRLIDLSHAAARLLDIERQPARVRLRTLPPGGRTGPVRGGNRR